MLPGSSSDSRRGGPAPVQVVTSAPQSLEDEQHGRITRYLLTMGVRTVAFVLAVVFDGPLRWVFAALAVFLPFFAVVAANAVRPRALGRVEKPTRRRKMLGS